MKPFKKLVESIGDSSTRRKSKRLSRALSRLPNFEGITLIDIGAAGDIESRWKRIRSHINYVGFEPDARSCEVLLEKPNACLSYQIFPFAIWDEAGSIQINLCRKPEISSYYSPNLPFLRRFRKPERCDVMSTESLEARTLDDLSLESSDFVKLDIQGGELKALLGGRKTLEGTLGLEVEVEFLPFYQDQPLFGEVSAFLTGGGFEFVDFIHLTRWGRDLRNGFGQCVAGDALFLRTPEAIVEAGNASPESISKYLSICLLYNRFDLIDTVLDLLSKESQSDFSNFKKAILPISRSLRRARSANRLANTVLRMAGRDELRVHMLY